MRKDGLGSSISTICGGSYYQPARVPAATEEELKKWNGRQPGEADARATVTRGACKTVGSAHRDIGFLFLYDFDEPKSLNFKHQTNKFDAAPPE